MIDKPILSIEIVLPNNRKSVAIFSSYKFTELKLLSTNALTDRYVLVSVNKKPSSTS